MNEADYNPARRVDSVETSLSACPIRARDGVLSVIDACLSRRGENAELRENELKFLLEAWTNYRYDFVTERFDVDGVPADYCTLILAALSKSSLLSCTADELYARMADLSHAVNIDWTLAPDAAKKASFIKLALHDLTAWEASLTFLALDEYDECIVRCLQVVLAIERGELYSHPGENDVPTWSSAAGTIFPTSRFLDDVDAPLCGLLHFHSFLDAVVNSGDEAPVTDEAYAALHVGAANWRKTVSASMSLSQFLDAYFASYAENAVRPGECFAYNKKKLHFPNTPREAVAEIRPPVFKQAYDSSTMHKMLFEDATCVQFDAVTLEYARNVATLIAAILTLQSKLGLDLRSRVVSYSQCEAYGIKHLDSPEYPAIAWAGRFFVAMEKRKGGRRVASSNMLHSLAVLFDWEAERGNVLTQHLASAWKNQHASNSGQ